MHNQFRLLGQRRFAPFFGLQFLGALNDNLYKTALLVLITQLFAQQSTDKVNFLNNLGAAAFIFPFFLFSATAGQLADKFNKRSLIRIIKFAEIIIALLICVGFYMLHVPFLMLLLFLLGTQAAFFSPVKYSVLPQYLYQEELMGGNGMVEMGTFVAILLGTILGGLLIAINHHGTTWVSTLCVMLALFGWLCSLQMPLPLFDTQDKDLKINWEPFSQTWHTLAKSARNRPLLWTMIGISWFWFLGSMILTQIPNYTHIYLGGDAKMMTSLLIVASLGIGMGSISCEPLAKTRFKSHLVLLGGVGMTVFILDLSLIHPVIGQLNTTLYHILADLFLIGFFGGLYSVPLYVSLQTKSQAHDRSQMIAANSILNALFMTAASGMAIVLLMKISILTMFMILGFMNLAMLTLIRKAE